MTSCRPNAGVLFGIAVSALFATFVVTAASWSNASRALAQEQVAQSVEAHAAASRQPQALEAQRPAAGDEQRATDPKPVYRNDMVRGQVTWLSDALQDKFGISTVREARESSFVLVTADGELIPIVENLRGRAFRKDDRLRDTELELFVRRYPKQPFVQILRIFEVDEYTRHEVDYWCDVCAIIMFELGPCSCCQDDNRIRKRLVGDADFEKLRAASE